MARVRAKYPELGQGASDALGVSGKLMLRALEGRLTEAQRWILGQLLDQYDQREAALTNVAERKSVV